MVEIECSVKPGVVSSTTIRRKPDTGLGHCDSYVTGLRGMYAPTMQLSYFDIAFYSSLRGHSNEGSA
jgi:hypothetical protein